MKPFKIKKDSWHYKLNANFMQGDFMERWEYFHSDFCSYWRATIGRLILAAFMVKGALVILAALAAIATSFYFNPVESALAAAAIILICAFITFLVWLGTRNHNKPSKPDSLFMQKYKAHKAKICPMVEYEEN